MMESTTLAIVGFVLLVAVLAFCTYRAIRSDEQKDLREKYQSEATLKFSKLVATGAFLEGGYRIYLLNSNFFNGKFPDDWIQVTIEDAIKHICKTCVDIHTHQPKPATFCAHIDEHAKRMYLVLYVEEYPWPTA